MQEMSIMVFMTQEKERRNEKPITNRTTDSKKGEKTMFYLGILIGILISISYFLIIAHWENKNDTERNSV